MTVSLPSKASCEQPPLSCGQGFRIRSRSGRQHALTFLARGSEEAGLFVRLPTRHLARLDPQRVDWGAFEDSAADRVPVIGPGDEILIDSATAGSVRGTVCAQDAEALRVERERGVVRCTLNEILFIHLAYRAPSLRRGDRFCARSRSGNHYRGVVTGLLERTVGVELEDGRLVSLNTHRLDLQSVRVLVPIDLGQLRNVRHERFAQTVGDGQVPTAK